MQDMSTQSSIAQVLQANKDHQQALKQYIEELEAKLGEVEPLLDAAQTDDEGNEEEVVVGGHIIIPGSEAPLSMLEPHDFTEETSPFHQDASIFTEYMAAADGHTMAGKSLEALAEAVREENYRLHAYEAQRRGEQPLMVLGQKPPSFFEQNLEGIRWQDVATKVSGPAGTFTAEECEIKWTGSLHPSFNSAPWSDEETVSLRALISGLDENEVDWVTIAEDLGTGRTPLDCMRHAYLPRLLKWNTKFDQRLLDTVERFGTDDWYLVSQHISELATPVQCESRYSRIKPDLRKVPWSEEEDVRLRLAHDVYGKSWIEVAVMIPGRGGHQCSERWSELMLKGETSTSTSTPAPTQVQEPGWHYSPKWSLEEERVLWIAVQSLGQADWVAVALRMGNKRAAKAYKTRFRQVERKVENDPSYLGQDQEAATPVVRAAEERVSEGPTNTAEGSCTGPVEGEASMLLQLQGKSRPRPRRIVGRTVAVLGSDMPEEDPSTHSPGPLLSMDAPVSGGPTSPSGHEASPESSVLTEPDVQSNEGQSGTSDGPVTTSVRKRGAARGRGRSRGRARGRKK